MRTSISSSWSRHSIVRAPLHIYLFFREFRKKIARGSFAGDTSLWIDALCIDQKNTIERNAQVSIMADIYASTAMTISWLGWSERGIEHSTFDFIARETPMRTGSRKSSQKYEMPHTSADSVVVLSNRLQAVAQLCKCSYFQRRWILEEIFWSPTTTICWGEAELNWVALASFLHLFPLAIGSDTDGSALSTSQIDSPTALKSLVAQPNTSRRSFMDIRDSTVFQLVHEIKHMLFKPTPEGNN